jgi:hypothetical protein
MNRHLMAFLAASSLALSACGGGGGGSTAVPAPTKAPSSTGQVVVKIVVPLPPAGSAVKRKPAYVSPATQSVTFQVGSGTVQVVPLVLGSATCPLGPNGYLCTAYANVPAGNGQTLTVLTYGTTDGTGPILSAVSIGVNITAGAVNPVLLTLNGIAASLTVTVTPAPSVSRCVPSNVTATWSAQDAAGYTIIGPGNIETASGTLVVPTLTTSDPTHFQVGSPSGNTWLVSYNGQGGTSPVTFSVSNPGVTTGNTPVAINAGSLLFATRANDVYVFSPPYTARPAVITNGVSLPSAVLVSPSCTLFIANANANYGTNVTAYLPPYTGVPIATMNAPGVVDATLSPAGNIFTLAAYPGDNVLEFTPPYTGIPVQNFSIFEADITSPTHLAVDSSNDVFVVGAAYMAGNTVAVFTPPYASIPPSLSGTNNPQRLLVQAGTNDLFVSNLTGAQTAYTAPYTGTPFASIAPGTNIDSAGMAFDASNNLFVAFSGSSTVVEYAPPYTGGALQTISSGLVDPVNVAVDPATGNLFVANIETNQVTIYAPPYTAAPFATLSVAGTNGALAISP